MLLTVTPVLAGLKPEAWVMLIILGVTLCGLCWWAWTSAGASQAVPMGNIGIGIVAVLGLMMLVYRMGYQPSEAELAKQAEAEELAQKAMERMMNAKPEDFKDGKAQLLTDDEIKKMAGGNPIKEKLLQAQNKMVSPIMGEMAKTNQQLTQQFADINKRLQEEETPTPIAELESMEVEDRVMACADVTLLIMMARECEPNERRLAIKRMNILMSKVSAQPQEMLPDRYDDEGAMTLLGRLSGWLVEPENAVVYNSKVGRYEWANASRPGKPFSWSEEASGQSESIAEPAQEVVKESPPKPSKEKAVEPKPAAKPSAKPAARPNFAPAFK
ncbi:MAG TPA: hypothetical protein PL033_01670 [Candidatus Brocadiia bacterium]|nr:hypothetical protein [Candidatus Brocadiia bacterium]